MAVKKTQKKPDSERSAALKSLPPSIRHTLSDEDIETFLYQEVWPESLCEKLEDFISKPE